MHNQLHLYFYFKMSCKLNKISISELNCLLFSELECSYRELELLLWLLCERALTQNARSPGLIPQLCSKPSPAIHYQWSIRSHRQFRCSLEMEVAITILVDWFFLWNTMASEPGFGMGRDSWNFYYQIWSSMVLILAVYQIMCTSSITLLDIGNAVSKTSKAEDRDVRAPVLPPATEKDSQPFLFSS